MSLYNDLDDEAKIMQAINFVATGAPIPEALEKFLRANGLYEIIVKPGDIYASRETAA